LTFIVNKFFQVVLLSVCSLPVNLLCSKDSHDNMMVRPTICTSLITNI
jgi:hypothetical protein